MNTSVEKENENFLNESDANGSSSDDDLSAQEEDTIKVVNLNDQKKAPPSLSQNKADLLSPVNEKLKKKLSEMNSSQIDAVASSSSSSSSSSDEAEVAVNPNLHDTSHACTYYIGNENQLAECEHQAENLEKSPNKTISQKVCSNCDFKQELADSLEHMAFYSPTTSNSFKKGKFYDELKFDSPTLCAVNDASDKETEETILNDSTIINETITEDDLEEQISSLNANQSIAIQANNDEGDDASNSMSRSRLESGDRTSISMSDTTLMLSDSDDSYGDEFHKDKEIDYELKRKKALEQSMVSYRERRKSTSLSSQTNSNFVDTPISTESWFTPYIVPPLESELEQEFKVNNDPIVKYYKRDDKFKIVNV